MHLPRLESIVSTTFLVGCWVLTIAFLGAGGCSDSAGVVPVHGKVSYRGEPISSGALTFYPETGRQVSVTVNEQGDYSAELPPGVYRATVNVGVLLPPGYKEGDPIPPQPVVLPAKYTTQAQTPLNVPVTEEQSEPIDFDLQ